MATVKAYIAAFRSRRETIGVKFDVDLRQGLKGSRVAALAHDALLAVVVKTLVDKGVLTNAELDAVFDEAWSQSQTPEPAEPPPPN